MKTKIIVALLSVVSATSAQAASFSYSFDNVLNLVSNGWILVNNSNGTGSTNWFQGDIAVFGSQTGAPNAYVAANFNNASFGGNISNWLLTPLLSFAAGDTFAFYTRTDNNTFNDTLQLRLSLNGSSANVGSTTSSVGDFTNLLLNVTSTSFPVTWALQTFTLTSSGTGRFAFRYLVTDTSVNGNYIGIDTVAFTDNSGSSIPEPLPLGMLVAGLGGLALLRRRAI